MPNLIKTLQRLFPSNQPIPAGTYHYQAPPDDPRNYRLHLRLEENRQGILIVNAATILHLNQTAAEYAFYYVNNTPPDEVARLMSARYQIHPRQAREDYLQFADRIRTLVEMPDLDPVTFLDFDRLPPYTGRLLAPYRLDCALTYALPADEPTESAPVDRVTRELSTEEWKTVLKKAWDVGIPHIIFTGGEPTLREDLPELIRYAEALGQVTGLLSDGLRLADQTYLNSLLQVGLDHLLIILRPESNLSWQAVVNSLAEDLSVAVHLTITPQNRSNTETIVDNLVERGVQKISLSISELTLESDLQKARDLVAARGLELIWNLPVPYRALHPVALEAGDTLIEGAGRAWLYVEPDGDVRPTQGHPDLLGNFLRDPWDSIWKR